MNRILGALAALTFAFVALPSNALTQETLAGDWVGALDAGAQGTLQLVFHLTEGDDGGLGATLDSPDQGAFGIEAGPVTVDGQSIRIEVPAVAGHYEGTIAEDGKRIDGNWNQGGMSMPLALEPAEEPAPEEAEEEGGR